MLEEIAQSAALREAFQKERSAGVRRRVEELLANPEWLRAVRAVEAIERLGTPGARQLVKALAEGAPEARLTHEAQSALRLGEKPSAAR